MSSSLMSFRGKSFWIHNAVAEVWFSTFSSLASSSQEVPEWLQLMLEEIRPALAHSWIDGIAMQLFDKHLTSPDRLKTFHSILSLTNIALNEKASRGKIVSSGNFDASSDFLVAEIKMIETIFMKPETVLEPWKIFTMPDGWSVP